jgi:ribulose-5-phosphate 4-epimerase/fuculose-1-phosphate aldolase
MTADEKELRTKMLKAWRFLYQRGFIEGFGHISGRLPGADTFLLTRHSLGLKAISSDLITVDLQGRKLAGKGDIPGEYPIHSEILRARPDICSIIHYHGMHATAFTTSEIKLKPIHIMGTLFADWLPIYGDPRLVQNPQRGQALAQVLGPHRAALLRAHGVVVTGGNVEEAVTAAFLLEENAHRAYLSCAMGKPIWIEDQLAADAAAELLKSRGPFRRVWAMVEGETKA